MVHSKIEDYSERSEADQILNNTRDSRTEISIKDTVYIKIVSEDFSLCYFAAIAGKIEPFKIEGSNRSTPDDNRTEDSQNINQHSHWTLTSREHWKEYYAA